MKKEEFMALGISEELSAKAEAASLKELGGYVEKARHEEAVKENKTLQQSVLERDKQLETLKQSEADAAALQQQMTQLQADNSQKDQAHAAEIKKIRVENAMDKALGETKAINPATVKLLLAAFLEKAEPEEDGTIHGLKKDELEKLIKGETTSFLFKADGTAGPSLSGATPAGTPTTPLNPKAGSYKSRLADARKSGNSALAVAVKREAAADGVQLF